MKKERRQYEVAASPDEILDAWFDESLVEDLARRLDKVSSIEITPPESLDDGRIRHVLRFTAPTRLPGLLKRFKDRAPDEVRWDEISIVDPSAHRIDYEIIPDVPDHWHDYYENRGVVDITAIDDDRSRLEQSMTFSVDAPTGFGMFINRGIKSELTTIFDTRAHLLNRRFRS